LPITIRSMSPDDIDVVAPVITRAFDVVNARYGYPSEFPEPCVSVLMSRYYLSQDPKGCIVAEQDGNICGSVFSRRRGDRVSIGPVTVDPGSQAIGVGRRMMQAIFDLHPDAASFRLSQAAFNKESFSLYSKTGFVAAEQLLRLDRPPAPVASEDDEPHVRVVAAESAPLVAELDRRLTGAERERELPTLFGMGRVYVHGDDSDIQGYLATMPTPGPTFLGPAVAHSEAQLAALVRAALRDIGPHASALHLPARFAPTIDECFRLGFRLFCLETFMVRGEWRTAPVFYLHSMFPETY
jgi:ribosomal protein S18 acetylase RimI-like enzyme